MANITKKFSDFAEKRDIKLAGEKLKMKDVLGKEIKITGYKITKSKIQEGDFLTLQFELDGIQYIIFSGSKSLQDLTTKYDNEIPFLTTIKQIGNSYTFT